MTPPPDGPTTLYRAYDASDKLLYIGIATNWARRWTQHFERSPWYTAVARITLETHPTRRAAYEAEREACENEHPLHNIEHTDRDTRPMRQPSRERPARYMVRSFDHRRFASIPEYQALAKAIDDAANRFGEADNVTHWDLEAMLSDIARTCAYGDGCNQCRDDDERGVHLPIAGHVENNGITTIHRCPQGHQWSWWHLDAPLWT